MRTICAAGHDFVRMGKSGCAVVKQEQASVCIGWCRSMCMCTWLAIARTRARARMGMQGEATRGFDLGFARSTVLRDLFLLRLEGEQHGRYCEEALHPLAHPCPGDMRQLLSNDDNDSLLSTVTITGFWAAWLGPWGHHIRARLISSSSSRLQWKNALRTALGRMLAHAEAGPLTRFLWPSPWLNRCDARQQPGHQFADPSSPVLADKATGSVAGVKRPPPAAAESAPSAAQPLTQAPTSRSICMVTIWPQHRASACQLPSTLGMFTSYISGAAHRRAEHRRGHRRRHRHCPMTCAARCGLEP